MFKTHPLVGKKLVEKKLYIDEVERSMVLSTFENVIFSRKYDMMQQPKKGTVVWYITTDSDNMIISVSKIR